MYLLQWAYNWHCLRVVNVKVENLEIEKFQGIFCRRHLFKRKAVGNIKFIAVFILWKP
jgi:hypothetical protein